MCEGSRWRVDTITHHINGYEDGDGYSHHNITNDEINELKEIRAKMSDEMNRYLDTEWKIRRCPHFIRDAIEQRRRKYYLRRHEGYSAIGAQNEIENNHKLLEKISLTGELNDPYNLTGLLIGVMIGFFVMIPITILFGAAGDSSRMFGFLSDNIENPWVFIGLTHIVYTFAFGLVFWSFKWLSILNLKRKMKGSASSIFVPKEILKLENALLTPSELEASDFIPIDARLRRVAKEVNWDGIDIYSDRDYEEHPADQVEVLKMAHSENYDEYRDSNVNPIEEARASVKKRGSASRRGWFVKLIRYVTIIWFILFLANQIVS